MKKSHIYFGLLILLALVLGVWLVLGRGGEKDNSSDNKPEIRYTRPTFLNEENYAFVESRLTERYKALEGLPTDAPVADRLNLYVSIASDEIGLGNLGKGKEYYEKALGLQISEPEKAFVFHRLSLVLVEMNDFDASIDAVNKALAITPSEPEYWKWLIAVRQDRYAYSTEQLKELYEQALLKTGNSESIKSDYVQLLTSIGDTVGAERVKNLTVVDPNTPAVELTN